MFADREDAGLKLGSLLQQYAGRNDVVVLALPRGGVPVGYSVAQTLKCPLDVFIVRKIGVPGQEELAMGAIASGGTVIKNTDVIHYLNISKGQFNKVCIQETLELERREREYRGDRPPLDLRDKVVIVVDDGIATGASMRAAAAAIRDKKPARLIVAAPIAAPLIFRRFANLADEVVCVETPDDFQAVGAWYEDFSQTTDDEVRALLHEEVLSGLRHDGDDTGSSLRN